MPVSSTLHSDRVVGGDGSGPAVVDWEVAGGEGNSLFSLPEAPESVNRGLRSAARRRQCGAIGAIRWPAEVGADFVEAVLPLGRGGWPVRHRKPMFCSGLGVVSRRQRVAESGGVAGLAPVKIGFRPSFSLDDSRDLAVQ